jgi:hypothetical protein
VLAEQAIDHREPRRRRLAGGFERSQPASQPARALGADRAAHPLCAELHLACRVARGGQRQNSGSSSAGSSLSARARRVDERLDRETGLIRLELETRESQTQGRALVRAQGALGEAFGEQPAQLDAALGALVHDGESVEGLGIGTVEREQAQQRLLGAGLAAHRLRAFREQARELEQGCAALLAVGGPLGDPFERLSLARTVTRRGAQARDQPQLVGTELRRPTR